MVVVSRDMTPNSIRSVTRRPGVSATALACAGILLFSPAITAAAQSSGQPALSRAEQRIRDYVRAHEAEQVGLRRPLHERVTPVEQDSREHEPDTLPAL